VLDVVVVVVVAPEGPVVLDVVDVALDSSLSWPMSLAALLTADAAWSRLLAVSETAPCAALAALSWVFCEHPARARPAASVMAIQIRITALPIAT